MAISKNTQANIDDSNPTAYPNGQVKDDSGTGDGFPLIQVTMSDIYEFFDKLMRLAGLTFNASFDNETNGYQFVQACSALAAKSDFILPLTTSAGVLQIPTALQILQLNEKLICKAGANYTTETQIKGTGATPLTVAVTSLYQTGDYVMLVRTSGGVQLMRLVTADNINIIVGDNNYLKAAIDSDEDTGTSTAKATTPASNKYIFTKRVTDPTVAIPFLATHSTPGLMSGADKTALDGFSSPIKNVGWFSGVDPGAGSVGAFYSPSGNIASAQIVYVGAGGGANANGGYTDILVTVTNAMANTNFFVRTAIQSSGLLYKDNNILTPVFVPLSATTFTLSLADAVGNTQNLKLHIEVIQLS